MNKLGGFTLPNFFIVNMYSLTSTIHGIEGGTTDDKIAIRKDKDHASTSVRFISNVRL